MRALVLKEFGTPLTLTDLDRPVAGPGRVLVRIKASGVNPLDTKIRAGQAAHAQAQLPAVLGLDLAGVVETAAEGFEAGDEVFGMVGGVGAEQGTLAEYAAVDARLLARKPKALSFREAASLPLVFITAWEALVDQAHVREGQRVLVHGGAGGIGNVAIQLAKARGAEVFSTGSTQSLEKIEQAGATAIDYTKTSVDEYVAMHTGGKGFDVVLDTVGGETLDNSFAAARAYTGHVVSALGWGTHSLAPLSFRAGTYSGVFTLRPLLTGEGRANHGDILRAAAALAEQGQLKPRLDDREFTLDTIVEAHDLVATGDSDGKVVVTV